MICEIRKKKGMEDANWWIWLYPFFSSILLWLAAPGEIECWPLAGVAFIPLLSFLERVSARKDSLKLLFWGGFLHGLLLMMMLLYWIVNVLSSYGGVPFIASFSALLLLCCYLACYPAVFLLLSRSFLSCSAYVLLFVVPSLWTGLEWVKSWLFTGFPWMDLGYYLAFQPWLLQGAEFFGHYGMTWILFFCNVGLWLLIARRGGKLFMAGVATVVVGYLVFSWNSLEEQHDLDSPRVRPGLVQGNISQHIKWDRSNQRKTIEKYITHSEGLLNGSSPPDFLVWPETAIPFYLQTNPLSKMVVSFVRREKSPLIAGVPWFEVSATSKNRVAYYNAASLLMSSGETPLAGLVFKSHLVPFGEYVPLKGVIPFLEPLVESAGNFTAGEISSPLCFPSISGKSICAGVLICYESIFPELSRKWANAGANILVNLTNDAWYGKTCAPRHTLAMTVIRAVETRRSIVRAANTGFSAFILPTGEIRKRTGLFVSAVAEAELPLRQEKTFYVRYGWLFGPFSFFLPFLVLFWVKR